MTNKLNIFIVLLLGISISAIAQNAPRIVVLYPNNVNASEEILEELKAYEKKLEVTEEMRKRFVNPNLPKHWQTNRARLLEFLKEQDFFSLITKTTSDQLTYLLNRDHDVIINFPAKDVSAANLNNYKQIAEKYDIAWVVNFTSLELTKESGQSFINAHLQLYNSISHRVWINKNYTSKLLPGCEASHWECALSNLVGQTTSDVHDLIEQKRHYWSAYAYERSH